MKKLVILGKGHENITATHKTTLELTKENYVTKKGHCIVAISCTHAARDIPFWLSKWLRNGNAIKISISCGDAKDEILAYGCKELLLSHPTDIVIRKSCYIDERTLAIRANKAAYELSRDLVEELKKGKKVRIEITPVT